MRNRLIVAVFCVLFLLCGPLSLAQEAGQAPPGGAGEQFISINLTGDVDLRTFLAYVSDRTGKRFIYDDAKFPSKKVTLLAPMKLPEDKLFSLLEAMLEYEGFALEPVGDWLIKVQRVQEAASKPLPFFLPEEVADIPDSDAMITLAYKLEYVGVNEMKTALATFLGATQAGAAWLQRSNIMIITGYARNIRRIVDIIRMVDNPDNVPVYEIIPLQHTDAETLGRQIARVLQAESAILGADRGQQPQVEVDIATNSLIVVAVPDGLRKIKDLIAVLDVKPEPGKRNFKIYRLKNAKAEDVAPTLQALIQDRPSGVRPVPGARGARGAPPGQPRAVAGTLGAAQVRIMGDDAQNAIIVIAPPDVQSEVEYLITELDRRRPQVVITALVVQVSGNETLDWGVELASWGKDGIGVTDFGFSTYDYTTGERVITEGLGLTGAVINDDQIPVLLRALLVDSGGKIVAKPKIVVNDNAPAKFQSEEDQPFTSVNTVTSTTATTSFGGYESAGTTLDIVPHIGEGDYLGLEISINLSQFTGEAPSPEVPPARRRDTLTTELTVPDQATIVIGGLSGYFSTEAVSKVPILGDIPLLGALFRRTRTVRDDSTEYIFIKAQIARDEDFKRLLDISGEATDDAKRLEATIERRDDAVAQRAFQDEAEPSAEEQQ
ncbi:MAG: secretin N-terminal domain-containing protein [Planctomycetota bacterium]|jgi:general secretion pathway protein D